MRDYDETPYVVIERHGSGVAPFLWGLVLGAGVALLFAPHSGAETQEEIRRRVRRARDAAGDRVSDARDSVTGAVHRTRDRIQDRLDSVRGAVETRAEQARDALDTGRRAARDARSELRRRVAEAKDARRAHGPDADVLPTAPTAEVAVAEVVIEAAEGRPDLG